MSTKIGLFNERKKTDLIPLIMIKFKFKFQSPEKC